jgi:hypothetical protein
MTMTNTTGNGNGPKFPSDRRERAKAMVEAGLFGGAGRGQGCKPKARTASEAVVGLAAQEAPAIRRAYSDGLRSKNERTRLYAADKLLAAERVERERRDDDDWPSDDDLQRMTSAELEAACMLALERAPVAAAFAMIEMGMLAPSAVIDSIAVESSA